MAVSKTVFKDREKEVKFWEKNYKKAWKSGKLLKVEFANNLSTAINVRLDPVALDIVREEAQKKGLGPTQLIRMWVMEKVNLL